MQLNTFLRYILIGGIFLAPFIAFIVSTSMFFPFITGKNFAFRILTEILFAGWLILALKDHAYRPRLSWILGAIAVFVCIIALADIFGVNPGKSIWSNFERMEGLVTLIHLLLYFVVVGSVLNTEKLWSWFWNTAVVASVFMGLYAILQLLGYEKINQGGVRVDAKLGNATYLGEYMLFHVFVTILLLARWRGGNMVRALYVLVIGLQLYILYHTATRGAILGFLGGAVITALLIMFIERGRPILRKISIGTLVALVLVVGGFFLIKDTQFVTDSQVLARFSKSLIEDFKDERLAIWKMALEGFKDRPVLGWGQENFNFVFNKHYTPELYDQEQWFDRVHNIMLDWLIAGGVLGLLSYLSLYGALLYLLWFKGGDAFSLVDKSVLTGFIAAYGFHNLFVFDNIVSYILFFSLLAYVHGRTAGGVRQWSRWQTVLDKEYDLGLLNRVVTPLIIIVLVFSLYFVNIKGIGTATTLIDALSQQETLDMNLRFFKKALAYDSFGNQEVREQLIQVANRMRALQVDDQTKQNFFVLARDEMEKQLEEVPDDARTTLFLATLFDGYGDSEKALQYYTRAHELSPQKQVIRFQIGSFYLGRGEYQKALELFKETFELEPNYSDARMYYAAAAIYTGNTALVEELLTPIYGSAIVNHDQILRAYFNTEQFTKVLAIWKMRIEAEPENAQYHLSLAAAYLELNDRANAIAAIEKVIELDPNFKEQGEYLIGEIRAGRNPTD